ncbi:hypothetical protein DFH28DRAFT_1122495 [Melampsora americana]|nr:hypothetical protein DFH28DRAFT_1122495 [Melampsora americana]
MPKEWWDSVGETRMSVHFKSKPSSSTIKWMKSYINHNLPVTYVLEQAVNEDNKDNEEEKENEDKNKDKNAPQDCQGLTAAEQALDSSSQNKGDELPVIEDSENWYKQVVERKREKKETKPIQVNLLDSDVDDEPSNSEKKQPSSKENIEKKTPACTVKPGTLANAIASASKDLIKKAKKAAEHNGIKATASAESQSIHQRGCSHQRQEAFSSASSNEDIQ